jgi:hypothetical protein
MNKVILKNINELRKYVKQNRENFTKPLLWLDEPDEWEERIDDFHLVVYRNAALGFLNGYVGVPLNHKLSGEQYETLDNIYVHGGLTFSDYGEHLRNPIFDKNRWYFGFDTGHCGDFAPVMHYNSFYDIDFGDIYRDMNYVKSNVVDLYDAINS